MHLLKSFYISAYATFVVLGAAYALFRLNQGPLDFAWAGFAVTTLPFALFLIRAMLLRNTARTEARLPVYMAITFAGVATSAWAVMTRDADVLGLLLAGVGGLGFGLYNFWYSRFGRSASTQLEVGSTLPDFHFATAQGATLALSQLEDESSYFLLIFYRGNWCPLCVAQIKELAGEYRQLAKRGVEVLLVSPQPVQKTAALAKSVDAPMRFVTDVDGAAARALNIVSVLGTPAGLQALGYDSDTVLPTVVLTDSTRKIIWRDETDNYRVRPEPATFLKVLDAHATALAGA